MAGTAGREYVKMQIDYLPEFELDGILRAINAAKLKLVSAGIDPGLLFRNDSEYLSAVPGMTESIIEGMNTPLSECVPLSEVFPDV